MTERKPLWASSLADQPQSAHDDVIVRVLEDEPEEPAPATPTPAPAPDEPQHGRRRALLDRRAAVPALLAALAIAVPGLLQISGSLTIENVPSNWGNVPMRCDTVRVEQGDGRAHERFRCRAIGGRPLPPGVYRSPRATWYSDITQLPSRESLVRITPDGVVTGSATY